MLAAGAITAPLWARKQRGGWPERFGKVGELRAPSGKPRIMLHAVSVGEAAALRSIVPLLAEHADVIVSTTTDTGLARATALYAETCDVVRYPLDFSWSVRRFLDRVKPDAVGLVELELWPQFLAACTKRGIPACVINGRLSPNSFRNYDRSKWLVGGMFRRLSAAGAQDEAYAQRFRAMGAPNVQVTGSVKWDNAQPASEDDRNLAADIRDSLGIDPERPLIVGASTGPSEEAMLVRAHAALRAQGVRAQLLCAPRKPERFSEASAQMPGARARSAPASGGDGGLFLLDSLGELRAAFTLADVVVMGRTFCNLLGGPDLGGSDPTEPAAMGAPVILGPETGNFRSIVEALQAGGAVLRAQDEGSLVERITEILTNEARRSEIAAEAARCVRAQQGASRRSAGLLLGLVEAGG